MFATDGREWVAGGVGRHGILNILSYPDGLVARSDDILAY
jgi:hypothetical protein